MSARSRRDQSRRDAVGFSPHEPVRPLRGYRNIRPRRLHLLDERPAGAARVETPRSPSTEESKPNVVEQPLFIPSYSDDDSRSPERTERDCTEDPVDARSLIKMLHLANTSTIDADTEHSGGRRSTPPTERHAERAAPVGSAVQLEEGEELHEDRTAGNDADSTHSTTAASTAMGNSFGGRGSTVADNYVPPVLYVHPGRLTRGQRQTMGGAKSGALLVNERTIAAVTDAAPSDVQAEPSDAEAVPRDEQERIDAQIAAALAGEEEDGWGGDLSASQDESESSYEASEDEGPNAGRPQSVQKSAKKRKVKTTATAKSTKPGSKRKHGSSVASDSAPNKRVKVGSEDDSDEFESDQETKTTSSARTERVPKIQRPRSAVRAKRSVQNSSKSSAQAGDEDEDGEEDEDVQDVEIPQYLYEFDGPQPPLDGSFANGLQVQFDTWEEFDSELRAFTHGRFQLFKKRTSKNVADRNKKITKVQNKIPDRFIHYNRTVKCVHGMRRKCAVPQAGSTSTESPSPNKSPNTSSKKSKSPPPSPFKSGRNKSEIKPSSKSVKKRRFSRYTGCTATINATVQRVQPPTEDNDGFAIRWRARGGHNHPTTKALFVFYPEIRMPRNDEVMYDVERLISAGANATGITKTYRRETGLPMKVRDMQNTIRMILRDQVAGSTVEDRVEAFLRSFVSTPGNWSTMYVDGKTKETQSVAVQSARMQRLFAAAPQVVMVDSTHGTNKSRFSLFSFVVHDLFGKGQYVYHSLMKRETMDNMEDAIEAFIKANPASSEIRAFVVDKDFKERKLLRTYFPHARILLCHYHVIKIFAKKVKELVRGTHAEKEELIAVMRAMVYARSKAEYDALRLLLAKKLAATMGADAEHSAHVDDDENDLFEEDEEESDDEDPSDAEESDNAINFFDDDEARNIALEAVRNARDDEEVRQGKLHRFFRYFQANWEPCEREWLMFLRGNVAYLGNNTNNRIEAKWGAIKRILHARMDLEQTLRAIFELQAMNEDEYIDMLTKIGSRHSHSGDPELDLLVKMLSDHAYDLVQPEYSSVKEGAVNYNVREGDNCAILKSTTGDDREEHTIDLTNYQCSCLFAQVRLLPCRHVFFYRKHKGFQDVIPFKHVNGRWSLRDKVNDITKGDVTPSRFRVRYVKKKTAEQLTQGDKFCQVMSILKPLAGAVARTNPAVFKLWLESLSKVRDVAEEGGTPDLLFGEDPDGEESGEAQGDRRQATSSSDGEGADEHVQRPADTEGSGSDNDRADFKIASAYNKRPARNRQAAVEKKNLHNKIKAEAKQYLRRDSIPPTGFSLADVEAILDMQSYTFRDAIPLICGMPIERVDAEMKVKNPEHVVSATDSIRFILVDDVLERLAGDFNQQDNVYKHVVFVDNGKAVLSPNQIATMAKFHTAFERVNEVIAAITWLHNILITKKRLPFPFDNVHKILDKTFIADAVSACQTMPLGNVRSNVDMIDGLKILELASSKWLSTTTVLALLTYITSSHSHVGMVKPEFFTIKETNKDARKRVIRVTDPFGTGKTMVAGILNLDNTHWMSFVFSRDANECILYDPMRSGREERAGPLREAVEGFF